ncbi:MAG: PEP-CTERM sorting domain-containing protein [Spartobacteria bacterium]
MKTQLNTLLDRVDTRLAACAAAAGASLAVVPSSDASIVYVDLSATPIAIPATTAGVYLNVVTGVSNVVPASVPGWDVNPFSSTTLSWFNPAAPAGGVYVTGGGSSVTLVDNLGLGVLINAVSVYGSGASETTGTTAFNLNSTNNYVGFRFQNETTGNTTNFGWVRISLGATLTSPRSIIGYAYENTGLGILSGATGLAVPEPTTLGLLGLAAMGAFGVRAWRARKAA